MNTAASDALGVFTVLMIALLTLKMGGVIEWSWWWLLSPMWLPIALSLAVLAILGIAAGIVVAFLGVAAMATRRRG